MTRSSTENSTIELLGNLSCGPVRYVILGSIRSVAYMRPLVGISATVTNRENPRERGLS